MEQRYTINDLPLYSSWPARLLGSEPWQQRSKTPENVLREYDIEKWGKILASLDTSETAVSLADIDEREFAVAPSLLAWIRDEFRPMSYAEAHVLYMELVQSVLREYLPASGIVELGSGYGTVILKLARSAEFADVPFFAAEYTPSGREVLRRLAEADGTAIETGHCDFAVDPVTDLTLPPGTVIFTSFATPYVPELPDSFVESLLALQPAAVIHFEPCYEHCDDSLFGLLRRRYIEVNDYNRNLATLLKKFEANNRITIEREEPVVFGSNPLLSASVLAWRPLA
jgi:hypothetical protein